MKSFIHFTQRSLSQFMASTSTSAFISTSVALSFLGVLLAAVAGCSGGGGQKAPTGHTCAPNYNPFELDVPESKDGPSRKPIDPHSPQENTPLGRYSYEGAEIFYYQHSTQTRFHFQEFKNTNTNTFTTNSVCAYKVTKTTKPFSYEVSGISDLEITSADERLVKTISFQITLNNRFKASLQPLRDEQENAPSAELPSKVYNDQHADFVFYKMSPNNSQDFQIRSRHLFGPQQDEEITLLIKLKRVDL